MSRAHNSTSHPGEFSASDKKGLYKAIYQRRDVRGQFLDTPIEDEVLAKVLLAAHHAPSVGFMQPWNFTVIRSQPVKQQIHDAFIQANEEAALLFSEEKQQAYRALKLEGILESPINLCITCDRERVGPVVLGRTTMKEMDLYSTVCAVQNLWLAARAEGLGVGWVSIIHREALHQILEIPDDIVPVAYLCMGYTSTFFDQPELQTKGWRERLPLDQLIKFDRWTEEADPQQTSLLQQVRTKQSNQDFF